MTWYTNESELDYSKPIIAIGKDSTYLLVPSNKNTATYDWLNIETGGYNSTMQWGSAKAAIDAYSSYEIKNAEIKAV